MINEKTKILKKIYLYSLIVFIVSIAWNTNSYAAINIYGPQQTLTIPESKDFASLTFSDPWDMSNKTDVTNVKNMTNISVGNGMFYGITTSTDPYFWLLWGGYPGAYDTRNSGFRNPIDTDVFNRLTLKMYSGQSGTGQIFWFYKKEISSNQRYLNFRVYEGWNIYQIDLPPSIWENKPIGLRIDPVNRSNTIVRIDWVRLTNKPGKTTNLQWDDEEEGNVSFFVDNTKGNYQGVALIPPSISELQGPNSLQGPNTADIDLDGLYPGDYYFYLKKDGNNSNYSNTNVIINKAPVVEIISPNERGGRDWARAVAKKSWDMRSRSSVKETYNIAGKKFRGGIFSGINSSRTKNHQKNDPYFLLNLGKMKINSSRFHLLTFRYKYRGNFDLVRGTMSRFGWTTTKSGWQMSDDIVTWTGWNTITIDLKKIKLNVGNYGWRGWVNRFRFDPHEDPRYRGFYVDYVTLREDNSVNNHGYFDIKFKIIDDDPNVNLRIYGDKDRTFGNGNEKLYKKMTVQSGNYSWRWKPSSLYGRKQWIYIQASDGLSTQGFYSSGYVRTK